ncbi:uncharacterized protein LOC132200593 isoform X2 [Neocloeon triangulifer]|uniref:uncharacterized protein LOC132200593 isoform X2 n=1 Tax=Neocloeon triangulifer TaxID=2078957 RepID=UPI00286F5348|nr:uncharacterized protein LOC132200593 isoform X2 [Neocloeon triangulifer]
MDQLFESEARVSAAWRSTLMALQLFIFILDMVSDVAVSIELFKRVPWAGGVCLSFVFVPIVAYGVHETVKLFTSEEEKTWQKVVGRVLDILFCPMFAFIRYLEKLFWLIEASISKSKEQRELAERRAEEPRRIEWYIAWRALFQAAPQSLLQMMQLLLIADVNLGVLQVVCAFTSILSVTIFASKFSRFESQDANVAPWPHQKLISDKHSNSQSRPLLKSSPQEQRTKKTSDVPDSARALKFPPLTIVLPAGNTDSGIEADVPQSPPPPPLPPRASSLLAPNRPPSRVLHSNEMDSILSENDYKKMPFLRYSYVERSERMAASMDAANRRSSYHYLQAIESDGSNRTSIVAASSIITPPDFPAPAPPEFTSLKPPPGKFDTVGRSALQLPTRKKGRKYLESDSTAGIGILHLHWFLFFISRTIALGGLLTIVPYMLVAALVALGAVVGHVAAMAAVITVNSDRSTVKIWRSILIAASSLYCLVEFGVKFEKITRIMVIYWPLIFVENFAAGFFVYRPDATSVTENWWSIYFFYTMIVTYVLAVACLMFYKLVLHPRRYVIYYE